MQFSKILGNRNICDVLDGDNEESYIMKNGKHIELEMPYLGSRELKGIYKDFGLLGLWNSLQRSPQYYDRWEYIDVLLRENMKCDTSAKRVLTKLFDKGKFLAQYHDPEYGLRYKERHVISEIAMVAAVLDINDILCSYGYKLVERNMEFYLDSTKENSFDSYLESSAKKYINQDNVPSKNKLNNSKQTKSVSGNSNYNNVDNSNDVNVDIKFSNYVDLNLIGNKIDYNIDKLSDGLSGTPYKNNLDNAKTDMKHKHFSKAWKILRKIPSDVLKANKVLTAAKSIATFCKAVAMLL